MRSNVKHRVFVDFASYSDDEILVADRIVYHYVAEVLRLKQNDNIILFNGKGKELVCEIICIEKTGYSISFKILDALNCDAEENVELTLAQAVLKGKKMDLVVQKCTEIGVDVICPFLSARTVITDIKNISLSKLQRWQKISIEAARQSGRIFNPQVSGAERFSDIVDRSDSYDLALIPCLDERSQSLKRELEGFKGRTVLVFIGPEGGFTADEITHAVERGVKPVCLGELTLRSETASIAVSAVLKYEFMNRG